jgi:trehalose 6-phosphate phosphatase
VTLSVNTLAREVFELFSHRPAGLLSDIDGTLSRIALDPAAAEIEPLIKASLLELMSILDVVGVVTGRSPVEASQLVGLDGVIYMGNHGIERLENGEVVVAGGAAQFVEPLKRVLDSTRAQIDEPLVYFENKGVTGSIHYRNAPDPAAAREQILRAVTPLVEREGLRLSQGRMVVELRPPIDLNKGTALQSVVDETGVRSILFMGDDVTDLDAMRAVKQLREDGKTSGLSIGVIGPETPEAVAREADRVVEGVEGVSRLLAGVVELFAEQPGQR